MAISSPFMWGSKGRKMSPEALERERAIIDGIKGRVGDTSPVGHWLQGAGRVVDAITGQIRDRRADASEQLGLDSADDFIANNPVLSSLVGGQAGGGYEMHMPELNVPPVGGADGGFPASLIDTESGGNWGAYNNEVGAGGVRGHGGRLQFGQKRLEDAANAGVIPRMTPQQFAQAAPEIQQAAEKWHFSDIDRAIDSSGAAQMIGQTINGIPVTRDGLRAVAHLGGSGGMRKFVESGGQYNPSDSFGTSLSDYLGTHAGGVGNRFAGGSTQMADNSGVVSALSNAMSDPWVAKKYGPAIQAMLGQQMKRGDMQYQAQLQAEMQANDPLRQAQIDKIYGRNGATDGAGSGVRSSQILADGTLVQSTDSGPRVFGPTGEQLTGQEAADAIKAANAYDVENQQQIYGGRRSGTLGADIDMGGKAASSVESGKIAAAAGNAAYEGYQKVMGNLSNIYDAVAAIDSGAKSGITQKYLPNISVASATLANTMNRMGLDVIGSVTFGALSEAEMNLAMDTAVPRDLSPPELREWLVAKGEAQQKAAEALYQAGQYLSKPGNTLESWMAQNPPEFAPFGPPQTDTNPQPQSDPAQGGEPMASQPGNFPDFGAMSDEELDAFLARTGGGQ